MSGLDKVPPYYMPVTEQEFKDDYLADREKVAGWVGKLFEQNVFDKELSLSHEQLSLWVGSYAMDLMSESSYRSWTFDDYKDKTKWTRIIWRLVHIYPLGFLISKFKFSKGDGERTWNPAVESFTAFSKGYTVMISPSNRYIHGSTISQAMYQEVFGGVDDFEDNNSIMLAVFDAFSARPNPDNPLFASLRRAIKKTLYITPYKVPYFWYSFLDHLYGSIPNEHGTIMDLLEVDTSNLTNFINEIGKKYETPEPTLAEVLADSDVEKIMPAPIVAKAVVEVIKPIPVTTKEVVIEIEKNVAPIVAKAVIEDTKPIPVTSKVIEQPIPVESRPDNGIVQSEPIGLNTPSQEAFIVLFTELCNKIKQGFFKVNTRGAVVHKISNRYFFVHDMWLKRLIEDIEIPPKEAKGLMVEYETFLLRTNKIKTYEGFIEIPNNVGFKPVLALINPELEKILPDILLNAENNKDIKIMTQLSGK